MVKNYIKEKFNKLLSADQSVERLALSFCLGNFIAWTPTIPFQTPLIFVLSWALRLNTTVTFITSYTINNPITMVPIYVIDYFFGHWLLNTILKIDAEKYNPSWIEKFNAFLSKYIDLGKCAGTSTFCFWCLVIGGLTLALILSLILYPIMKLIFKRLVSRLNKKTHNPKI